MTRVFFKIFVVDLSLHKDILTCIVLHVAGVCDKLNNTCDKNMKDTHVTWPRVEDILCTPLEN